MSLKIDTEGSWLGTLRWLENRSKAAPLGEFFSPIQEPVSLRGSVGLGFPARSIEHVDKTNSRPGLVSPLFSLNGPLAALPYTYSEQLLVAKREYGSALPDFFDIFNHRAQSLLYRALRKHRYVLGKERALADGVQDGYSMLLSAFSGLLNAGPTEAGIGQDISAASSQSTSLPPDALISFAGLFARRTRSAGALALMLQRYFRLNIRVRELAGHWVSTHEDDRCQIGFGRVNPHAGNNRLGSGLLGKRSWQATAFFCIEIHDPDCRQFAALKPAGTLLRALCTMVRHYAGEEFDFHIEIFVAPHLQTTARLGRPRAIDNNGNDTGLGWRGVLGKPGKSGNIVIRVARLREQ
jgi:type VI secretion system protein ImpH